MNITTTVKKVVTDQAYATVGATDLAVETVRTARAELAPARVQARVKAAPVEARVLVEKRYTELTDRGEKLVTRIRNQAATKDLVSQAEATLALGKGVVTTVRNAVGEVERSAKSTLTIGRKEAVKAAEAVVDSVEIDTDKATKAVSDSAKRTRTAAKRTTTTAKKAGTRTKAATKRATTSARKTAAASAKATEKAAEKVGD